MSAPSVQPQASAASARGKPGQIRCMNGGEWQDRAAFNPKRIRDFDQNRRENKAITPFNSFISCKAHSGHVPGNKQCVGGCLRILPLDKFSKNSIRQRKFKCIDCTQHQVYLEPHDTAPAPNTLLDTAEKEELEERRRRREERELAAAMAVNVDEQDDDTFYDDDMFPHDGQSDMAVVHGGMSTFLGAIGGNQSLYSARQSEATTSYTSEALPPHLRSKTSAASTSALAARLEQDGSYQDFFSNSYAAVSTSANTGYAPSDALLTDGRSTLGPEDSGSVVADLRDGDSNGNPAAARRKLFADHETVTQYYESNEAWRLVQKRESLSSGKWAKPGGRKWLPQAPDYVRDGELIHDEDVYEDDCESPDEL
ncbi:hypothetical protein B0T20DRAFT_470626 [Sordaria brevicollis]|uniref:Stc1 domain-containing protein n=1 Tax=Sordaria brevicollis TaxID=83679 RepID=A0AAE0UAJ9_SORBR|nr:hypothetical protein B0T20DRAFT_470626 [Sordaria brevicollis]